MIAAPTKLVKTVYVKYHPTSHAARSTGVEPQAGLPSPFLASTCAIHKEIICIRIHVLVRYRLNSICNEIQR